jgi:hypothetical protein
MDGLTQVAVLSTNTTGISEVLGLRGDGLLFRGQVTIEPVDGKASITEEIRK